MKTALLLFAALVCTQTYAMDKSSKPKTEVYVAPDSKEVRNSKLMFGDHVPPFTTQSTNKPWSAEISIWHTVYEELLDHAIAAIRGRKLTLENSYPTLSNYPEMAEDITKIITELTTLEERLNANYEAALGKAGESRFTLRRFFPVDVAIAIPTADIRDCAQWTDGGKKPALVLTFATGKVLMIKDVGLANILLNLARI
jgi:hypothetical protein